MYNPNVHHRKSIRIKGYDYSKNGLYFVTICTFNRVCLFSDISNDKTILSSIGKIVDDTWLEIPQHFPDVILHEHVVMPNHIHGIIEISKDENTDFLEDNEENKYQKMISKSISSIVKGFKIGVTKRYRSTAHVGFNRTHQIWQRNYYEHIIRNEESYHKISLYIQNNPAKWKEDTFY